MKTAFLDTEGDGLLPELTRLWCAVVKDKDDGTVRKFDPSSIDDLTNYLDSFDCLIGHNLVGYDLRALWKVYGYEWQGEVIDTLLMSRTQRPKRQSPPHARKFQPHSLEAWGYRVGRGKPAHEDWSQFTPAMLHRCSEDVEILELTYYALLKEGMGEGWENAHRLNARLFYNLGRQEDYGWTVDRDHMSRCLATLSRWIDRIDRSVVPKLPLKVDCLESKVNGEYGYVRKPFTASGEYAAVTNRWLSSDSRLLRNFSIGGPFTRIEIRPTDLSKAKEVKEYLLSVGWDPDEWNYNANGERTSPKLDKHDSFRGIQGSMGRLIAKRIQCVSRKSTIEGWMEKIRPDGRISPIVTGLATTARAKHSVIVNVPSPESQSFFAKQMRACFCAKPGWVMVGCDSKGNQVRQLAARMQEEEFTHAVLHGSKDDGTDLHSVNQVKSGAANRTKAKNFFYGFIFGAQPPRIAKELDCPVAEAKSIRDNYVAALPGLSRLIDEGRNEWRATAKKWFNKKYNRMEYRDGWIRGLDGRPILVEKEHMILCYFLQSDEAIQMAAAYNILHKWIKDRGYEYRKDWGMLIWYHDEVQLECRPEIAEELGKLASEAIAWAGRYYKIACPHEGEYKIGQNWSETH